MSIWILHFNHLVAHVRRLDLAKASEGPQLVLLHLVIKHDRDLLAVHLELTELENLSNEALVGLNLKEFIFEVAVD